MKKNFHHNRAPGQAGGRATEGWPRRGETSGSERVKEHRAHRGEEEFSVSFRISQPSFFKNFQTILFSPTSVFSVSSVVKPLSALA
jgi:hypothetical protein